MAPKSLLGVAILFVASCSQGSRLDSTLEKRQPFAAALARSDKCVLYEGLPHQNYEKGILQEELRSKETVRLHDFPFYAELPSLAQADADRLTALFCDAGSFEPWPGEKSCGGFHADYCLEWHVGADVYRAQVCFGCSEVKVFGPGMAVRWDVADDTLKELKSILRRYAKNRPPPDPDMPGAN